MSIYMHTYTVATYMPICVCTLSMHAVSYSYVMLWKQVTHSMGTLCEYVANHMLHIMVNIYTKIDEIQYGYYVSRY